MMRAYFDSNMAIYFVERHPTYFPQLIQHLLDATGNARVTCVTSDLVRLEARLLPMRDSDKTLLALYDEFFGASDSHGMAFDRAVFDAATQLRAEHKLKTPDALRRVLDQRPAPGPSRPGQHQHRDL